MRRIRKHTHSAITGLRPYFIDDVSCGAVVEWLVYGAGQRSDLECRLSGHGYVDKLDGASPVYLNNQGR
jgi:hypothetical protein